MVLLVVAAVLAVGLPLLSRALDPGSEPLPTLRPSTAPRQDRSISIDFGIVTDPATDWAGVDARLDQVGASTVDLNAGRTEFTAFDWPEHPELAADAGTDHLAVAARALHTTGTGDTRRVNLIVDAYVPEWIKAQPELAGVDAKGRRSEYTASASQLLRGAVGQRLEDYVRALAERYDPHRIELTELFLDTYTYGDDDRALYEQMTGATDWPRTTDGAIDTDAAAIGRWRSTVLAQLMQRLRSTVDEVRAGEGRDIGLVLDVRVDWSDPAAGRPLSGHDYRILLPTGVDLQLWVYPGRADRDPTEVGELVGALADDGYDLSRFIVSVGLWSGPSGAEPPGRLTPAELALAVRGAETHGVTAVNVTPYSLMTDAHWTALASVWA